MTPEEFKALIMAGDAQRLLDTLPNVADYERTALAKVAVSLTRTLETEGSWENNHAQCCANLAVFGIGTWDEVKRLGRGLTHIWSNNINKNNWILVFLTAYLPNCIERWSIHQMADDFNPAWPLVRALVRAGVG